MKEMPKSRPTHGTTRILHPHFDVFHKVLRTTLTVAMQTAVVAVRVVDVVLEEAGGGGCHRLSSHSRMVAKKKKKVSVAGTTE